MTTIQTILITPVRLAVHQHQLPGDFHPVLRL